MVFGKADWAKATNCGLSNVVTLVACETCERSGSTEAKKNV